MTEEIKNEIAVVGSTEMAATEAEALNQIINQALGEATTIEEYINQLTLEAPLKKALTALSKSPTHATKVQDMINYMAIGASNMAAGTWNPRRADLIRKMDPDMPEFRMGTFKLDGNSTPVSELKFLPLFYVFNRAYWPPYDAASKKPAICSAVGGVKGLFKEGNPHIRMCETCTCKEWGAVDLTTNKSKPAMCKPSYSFIGITPEVDGLYVVTVKGYDTNKQYNAQQKLRTGGRLLIKYTPEVEGTKEELAAYEIMSARIDTMSSWMLLSGDPIKQQTKTVSAGTLVKPSGVYLTHAEAIYATIYKKFAEGYINYLVDTANNYMARTLATSVMDTTGTLDTESKPVDAETTTTAEYTKIDEEEEV